MKDSKNISFALGTGRCGTKFLSKVMEFEPEVASSHEKHPLSDTFHRYCKWYNLPVDHEGFLINKEKSIIQDLQKSSFSFEASAYLSFSIQELYERFNPKFVLLIRSPEKVVSSYYTKGWYDKSIEVTNPNLIPSYQESKLFHHFLGRTLPKGEELIRWNKLTRIGKLSWFWKTLNEEVLNQFSNIPNENYIVVRLEDLDYLKYIEVANFIGFSPKISEEKYLNIVKDKPNSLEINSSFSTWSKIERTEFEYEVMEVSHRFQYFSFGS